VKDKWGVDVKKKKKTRLYRAKVLIKENIRGESSIQQALGLLWNNKKNEHWQLSNDEVRETSTWSPSKISEVVLLISRHKKRFSCWLYANHWLGWMLLKRVV
jgi:hypothetical protein